MTWISAIAGGGFLLACGPVLIHLLFRWRYRVVRFAAFRFLLANRKRSRQRVRIEELILILLRVLACVLIGLALADARSAAAPAGGAMGGATHLFVLDDSLSMGQIARGETLYRKAAAHVAGQVASMAEGDRVAIVSASRPGGSALAGPVRLLTAGEARGGEFAARLSASKPTDLRANFAGAIKAAAGMMQSQERAPVRLHVVSDFRRADFAGDEAASVRDALAAMDGRGADILLADFGLACRNNLAIERVTVGRSVVVAGVPTPIRVTVRNTGEQATAPSRLEVALGEAALPVQPVPALAPGQRTEVEFACTFEAAGSAAVRVSLPSDELPGDGAVALALEVRDSLRILIVDGSGNPGDANSASYALAGALDPSGTGLFGRRVEVQAAGTWGAGSLSAYDLVILTNVRDFAPARSESGQTTYPALRALEDYVRAGGGLVIFAGEDISPAFYNGPMYADGAGLCPLPLAEGAIAAPRADRFVRLSADSIGEAPMLGVLSSRGANFSRFVRFRGFVTALAPEGQPAATSRPAPQVLAMFDNGLPAVARRAFGRGAVVMWYTSPDMKWTNWPADLSFLPAMNDMAWELARVAENLFDDVAGRTIGYTLPGRLSGAMSAVLKTPAYPGEDIQSLALRDDGRHRTVSFAEPPHAGLYELTLTLADRTEHRVLFSRHPDARESDLARASEAELRVAVGRPFTRIAGMGDKAGAVEGSGSPPSLWWVFLAAAVAVLVTETVLGLRFAHYQPHAGGVGEAT
jgi:hypothetical protein